MPQYSTHHILSALRNDKGGQFLIYKLEEVDFNNGSVLTVSPSEEAIFVKNGNIVQVFPNGRYELVTENFPFLGHLRYLLSGGISTFHCSIYFVSLQQSSELLWGTSMMMRDPIQKILTKVFVRGGYRIRSENGTKLLLSLLGMGVRNVSFSDIKQYFGTQFNQNIISILSDILTRNNEEILKACTKLGELSQQVFPQLAAIISEYGLKLENFSISGMEIAEDDPNRFLLEQAYAKIREKELLDKDYNVIKNMDIQTNASKNEGFGNLAGATMFVNSELQKNEKSTKKSEPTTQYNESGGFDKLKELKAMQESGLITEEEYNTYKDAILKQLVSK